MLSRVNARSSREKRGCLAPRRVVFVKKRRTTTFPLLSPLALPPLMPVSDHGHEHDDDLDIDYTDIEEK